MLTAHLQLFPRVFTLGTAQRSYKTCTADKLDYDSSMEPCDTTYVVNPHDAVRSVNEPFEYLVNKPLLLGEVQVCGRGKIMAVAAGHVSA